jgi:hypothetical protein
MFHEEARKFIEKVIRTRKSLIHSGKSKLSPAWAFSHINNIERYLNYYGYKKDVDFAMFWHRHRNAILELIPGGNSKLAGKFLSEFNQIDGLHSIILEDK